MNLDKDNNNVEDSMSELERDAIRILSTSFDEKKIPCEKTKIRIRKPKKPKEKIILRGTVENKEKRLGKLIISNPLDYGKETQSLVISNFYNVDNLSFFKWKPDDLFLAGGVNFNTWIMIHFPIPFKFKDKEGSTQMCSHLTEDGKIPTSYYLEYRKLLLIPRKKLEFSDEVEEHIFENSFAVYTKSDEMFLNQLFPSLAPFPKCKNWVRMDFLNFLKLVVYPIYHYLLSKQPFIDFLKRKLRSRESIFLASEAFPPVKSIKWEFFYLESKLVHERFLISKLALIEKLIRNSFNLEKIFFLLLHAVIFDIDKNSLKF